MSWDWEVSKLIVSKLDTVQGLLKISLGITTLEDVLDYNAGKASLHFHLVPNTLISQPSVLLSHFYNRILGI